MSASVSSGAGSEGTSALLPAVAPPTTQDALELLHEDHGRIDALLADCEQLAASDSASSADASGLVSRLGALLIAHAQIERQLFYPAAGAAAQEVVDAIAEHEAIEAQLHQLSAPDFEMKTLRERVGRLAVAVRAHIAEEESVVFERIRVSGVDLHALGTQLSLRRGELLGHQGVD